MQVCLIRFAIIWEKKCLHYIVCPPQSTEKGYFSAVKCCNSDKKDKQNTVKLLNIIIRIWCQLTLKLAGKHAELTW